MLEGNKYYGGMGMERIVWGNKDLVSSGRVWF